MKLFINDKYILIQSDAEYKPLTSYDLELNPDVPLNSVKLQGHVVVFNGSTAYLDSIITLLEVKKLKKLQTITFVTNQYEMVKNFIKSQFKIVKAAGGLVLMGDKMLMIHRLGNWDLPKGKLEKGEKSAAGALREVEEECNIQVALDTRITNTWHTYVQEGRKILKKTSWYLMYCLDDSQMKPQAEEGIDDLRWMTKAEAEIVLPGTYRSIQEVYSSYLNMSVENEG